MLHPEWTADNGLCADGQFHIQTPMESDIGGKRLRLGIHSNLQFGSVPNAEEVARTFEFGSITHVAI